MPQKGKQSIYYETRPAIWSYAAVAGKKEHAGPLGQYFDYTSDDTYFGQKTWRIISLISIVLSFPLSGGQ